MGSDTGRDVADIIFEAIESFQRDHPPFVKKCVLMREATARAFRSQIPGIDQVYTIHVVLDMPEGFAAIQLYGGDPVHCPICRREDAERPNASKPATTEPNPAIDANRHSQTRVG